MLPFVIARFVREDGAASIRIKGPPEEAWGIVSAVAATLDGGRLAIATLGAVGTVLTLSAASLGLLLWPRKTGAFGSELTVKAADVPTVDGDTYHNIQGKFYLVRNDDGLLALFTKCPHLGCSVPYVGPWDSPQAFK